MMYASPVTVHTQSSGNTLPVRLFAVLFIICRRARAGTGMLFTPDHCISVFRLTRAQAVPPWRLCYPKTTGL
jgi:hypothetical protein